MDRREFLLALAALGLVQGCNPVASRQAKPPPGPSLRWQTLPLMPLAMQEIYPSLYQGHIVVGGGLAPAPAENAGTAANIGAMTPTRRFFRFDFDANRWIEGPPLPAPRHHLGLIANASQLWAIGGFSSNPRTAWQPEASVWLLSDNGRQWLPGPSLPSPQAEATYSALGDAIHVIGGRAPNTHGRLTDTNRHWRLEDGHQWHAAAPSLLARNSAAAAVIDGLIYQVAGRIYQRQHQTQTLLERYDPKSDAWQSLAPMPRGAAGLAAAPLHGQLYVFGGEHLQQRPWQSYDSVWRYDPATDAWSLLGKMTSTRHGLGAVVHNNHIHLVGGAIGPGADRVQASLERLILPT